MLLAPEKGLALNASGADILRLCTGELSAAEIAARLAVRSGREADGVEADVLGFLAAMAARGLVEDTGTGEAVAANPRAAGAAAREAAGAPRPYTLVAELT